MGIQRVPRQAFNRGKISRLGLGRTDVQRAELTAEQQTNWMPRVLGSMMLRPGWKWLGSTLSDSQAFLLPFIKSTDDTAFLEFTNESLRVWKDDVPIARNAVSTTIRGGDFSADITNFDKLADPSDLPAGLGQTPAFSPDGQFMAVAHTTTPFVTIYSISGTTFTKLANPTDLPAGNARGVAFSPNSDFMAVTHEVTPFVTIYSISGSTFTKLANPGTLPASNGNFAAFSEDGLFLSVAHATSPFVTIYEISGSTFTKVTNPGTLPASEGQAVAFSHDSRFMAVTHDTTPFVTIYDINGTVFTKLANPGTLPAGIGRGVAFSRDGAWLSVGHGTTPFITNYSISGTTFTKASNPATLPDDIGQAVHFSSDNQFLAVASSTTSPFHTLYRDVSGVWTKQTDLTTLPDGSAVGVAFSPNNRFLVVTHDTTQFLSIYQAYQWLDMDGSGAASTYASAAFEETFDGGVSDAILSGVAFNGHTVRQRIGGVHFTRSGSRVRVTFAASNVGTFQIDKCYIGQQSSVDLNIPSFLSAPTQVTFSGGSAGFSIAASATILSDEITFDFDEANNYVISYHLVGTSDNMACTNDSSGSLTPYYKAGDSAATVTVSGYTSLNATKDVLGVSLVEVISEDTTVGLSLVGTNYNDARRVQAISVLNTDKATEHGIRLIVRQGLVQFHVGTTFAGDDLVEKRELGPGTYSFAFTPNTNLFFVEVHSFTKYSTIISSIQIDGGGDLTLPTPYATASLTHIRHAQSGDIIYLACQSVQQQKVMRFGSASWGVADYLPEDGPFRNENTDFTTLTASALTGDITLTASKNYFKEDMVGTLFRVSSVGQATDDNFTAANQFSNAIKVTGVDDAREITIVRAGTWSATVTLQRSIGEPGTWTDVATFTTNGTATYDDGLDNQTIYYRIGIKTGGYTSGTAAISMSFDVGSIDGIARVTGFTSQTVVDAIVLSPMGGTTAFETWAEGIWSELRGWPSSVAIYEGRLAWSGMDRIILSESDGYENFNDLEEGDAGPIIRTIGEGPVDDIHWLLPLQRLLAGAEGSELSIRSNSFDEPLTPSNYNMKACSTQGSAAVAAVRIDSNGAFVERSGTRVYQLLYNFDTYDYTSADLTKMAPDMCAAGIKKIVLQRHPDTRLHCVLNDGTVAVLIFEADEDVICWIDIETDGDVEDCVVLPQQELEDAVYYVVNRTINGETKRYIEKWALEGDCVGATLNKQADSFLEYAGVSTTTITGLTHLEGESVVVWGGGADLGTYTVTSGQITGLTTAVTSAIVGLTYQARYKSCKLAYAAENGTALNARKRIAGLGLIAADMHAAGLKYGDSFDFLRSLPGVFKGKDVATGTVHEMYDDDLIALNGTWDTDTRLCLQADAPRPCTLLACTMVIETNA